VTSDGVLCAAAAGSCSFSNSRACPSSSSYFLKRTMNLMRIREKVDIIVAIIRQARA